MAFPTAFEPRAGAIAIADGQDFHDSNGFSGSNLVDRFAERLARTATLPASGSYFASRVLVGEDCRADRFEEAFGHPFVAEGVGVETVTNAEAVGVDCVPACFLHGSPAAGIDDMELVTEGLERAVDFEAAALFTRVLACAHGGVFVPILDPEDEDDAFVADAEADTVGDAINDLGGGEVRITANGTLAPAADGAEHGVVGEAAFARQAKAGIADGRAHLFTEDALHPDGDRFVAIPEWIDSEVDEVRLVLFEPI